MQNIIHICFSPSAGGSLRYAINNKKLLEGKGVISFDDDISQGMIRDGINTDERMHWWNRISGKDEVTSLESNYLKEGYREFYKSISKIKDSDVIYLWYGHCGNEICGMLYTLELLKYKTTNMYLINVSDMIEESSNDLYTYISMSEIMPEKLKSFIKLKRKIELKEYDTLLNEWNSLKNDNSILRIFKDGKIRSVKDDYFDIDILKYTEKELRKSARIVGSVMAFSEIRISDGYIFWRIKELVESGMIEFKGIFGVMREMEIKITQKGIEYIRNDLKAMEFWENREDGLQKQIEITNEAKKQGSMEEKITIAKKLIDVLDMETIAEKTGLTIPQVKNLKIGEKML
ncbi:DUF1835 domain-containing protein [Clostridium tagluense]|uniref:DUF1835 domain-containing protein n=1 Tax=Clostridium tagluense TaxID=360422 RepID=UPI001C0D45B7|nr:DUF1835 domain-containing protein [Clostridium tagluense]MBU3129114.1 DUF1835 domain-containing protein [Clostridium tagluense]